MKWLLKKQLTLLLFAALIFSSCRKNKFYTSNPGTTYPPPPTVTITCDNRPVINATLVPVGSLSEGRIGLVSATAGTKILFAGGTSAGGHSSRVDIYDTVSKTWSTAELTVPERDGMAVATVGSKIFFAGGGNNDWVDLTSRIDIYDAVNNTWSTAELSKPRKYLAAVTAGNKIYFAGGGTWEQSFTGSNVVDVYDNTTNTWSTASLSEGRYELSATTAGSKIYFAGGLQSIYSISKTIDVFDTVTNTWTTSQLQQAKTGHASIAVANKIFWAGGANTPYWSGYTLSDQVEIKDAVTGVSSFACITPKSLFRAVVKNDNILFFTGNISNDPHLGTHFEIYNTTTNQWSTGVLDKGINDATIISVNNTIYVAGGRDQPGSAGFKEVWKLMF